MAAAELSPGTDIRLRWAGLEALTRRRRWVLNRDMELDSSYSSGPATASSTSPPAAEPAPEATVFRYVTPQFGEYPKAFAILGSTARAHCLVQAVREGGENNLHYHRYFDGFWFVLAGRARFYTTGDELIADLGPHEGVVVPNHYPYWFESADDEVPLEILQFHASTADAPQKVGLGEDRVDLTPSKFHAPRSGPEFAGLDEPSTSADPPPEMTSRSRVGTQT